MVDITILFHSYVWKSDANMLIKDKDKGTDQKKKDQDKGHTYIY